MKKQSNLSRLLSYAGRYRNFTYASWILSAASALIALVPFDIRISVIVQRGVAGLNWSAAASVFDCLAQRLEGKHIPLAFKG